MSRCHLVPLPSCWVSRAKLRRLRAGRRRSRGCGSATGEWAGGGRRTRDPSRRRNGLQREEREQQQVRQSDAPVAQRSSPAAENATRRAVRHRPSQQLQEREAHAARAHASRPATIRRCTVPGDGEEAGCVHHSLSPSCAALRPGCCDSRWPGLCHTHARERRNAHRTGRPSTAPPPSTSTRSRPAP
jgi:hypothetical protein